MKNILAMAFLIVTTISFAQPRNHRDHGRDKRENHHFEHKKNSNKYKKGRPVHKNDYNYRVDRELCRYDFLRLNTRQRAKLQVSINFLINSNYSQREYERRLRADLNHILTRDQFRMWENRAYQGRGGNTFVFNFNS